MSFPKQHITKLTLVITKGIVMSVVFIAGVSIGVFNILMKSTEPKVNAKTRIESDQSKIVPKNTQDPFKLDKEKR
jgi:hypothetical protein